MCVITENVKNSRLLALFSTLKERDKDIVIAMTESLIERIKDNNTTGMTTTPVVVKRHLTMHVNWIIVSKPEVFSVLNTIRWTKKVVASLND